MRNYYNSSISYENAASVPYFSSISSTSILGSFLDGGLEDDEIVGGSHNDYLVGGSGFDTLKGGLGADSYYVFDGTETDIIFEDGWIDPNRTGNDVIYLPVGVKQGGTFWLAWGSLFKSE